MRVVTPRFKRAIRAGLCLCALIGALAVAADVRGSSEAEFRKAAGELYVHGMTREIAVARIGEAGVPDLVRLLWEPGFERRDNVVAFLGFLGDDETAGELIRFLSERPFPVEEPAEDRALLLIPEALGHIASRGAVATAVPALLELTAPSSGSSHGLVKMAIRGLMLSGTVESRARMSDLAELRIEPLEGFDAAPTARACLDWLDGQAAQHERSAEAAEHGQASAPTDRTLALRTDSDVSPPDVPAAFDLSGEVHQLAIDYANHVDLNSSQRMYDARLDEVFHEATHLIGGQDFAEDLTCCATLVRSGTAKTFGQPGDGLDVISSTAESETVLSDPVARFKVVRHIGWCGQNLVTNAIGCAVLPGWGGAVVRFGTARREGALWAHEFGHNLGFSHVSDARYIMYPTITGNGGVSSSQCWKYHNPPVDARVTPIGVGTCSDPDADGIHTVIDNCPSTANDEQWDQDADLAGDACDNCPDLVNTGQANNDQDPWGDDCDNCPTIDNPWQGDFDLDGYGDACETGALLADANLSGRVDGFDLASLARGFGAEKGDDNYDPAIDLSRDARIDGDDLAILAQHFGHSAE